MTTIFYYTRLFFIVSFGVLAANQDLVAQTASKTQSIQMTETGWQVVCRASGQDRTKLGCSLIHETFSQQDRVRIMAVEIAKGEKGRSVIVTVPQGVSLKDGIEFGIDGAKQSQLSYTHCANNSCFAVLDLTEAMVNTLKKGKLLEMSFQDLQGSKLKTDIPLAGFTQALTNAD
jgi:invasion protein IalB